MAGFTGEDLKATKERLGMLSYDPNDILVCEGGGGLMGVYTPGKYKCFLAEFVAGMDAEFFAHTSSDLSRALEALEEAWKVLSLVEWVYDGGCPLCSNTEGQGHLPRCPLAKVLRAAEEQCD